MTLVEPIPKPTYKKKRMVVDIPDSVKEEVRIRSHDMCEAPNCPNPKGDGRGLVFAHRFLNGQKTKGMGGTKRIPTAEEVHRYCYPHHLELDHHIKKG